MNADFLPRLLSALVLAPLTLLATWYGGLVLPVLLAIAAIIIYWEWIMMCMKRLDMPRDGFAMAAFAVIIIGAAIMRQSEYVVLLSVALLLLGVILVKAGTPSSWIVLGIGVSLAFASSLVYLRNGSGGSFFVLVFLFLSVWSADTFAYLTGRTFGGPKLWPAVSPKKTWSGFLGAHLGTFIVIAALIASVDGDNIVLFAILGTFLAFTAQAGDLMESAVKRRFSVKDTSNLIPGHGGLLDRVDGLCLSAVLLCLTLMWKPDLFDGLSLPSWLVG